MKTNREIAKENEETFQNAYDKWLEDNKSTDSPYWAKMWECVQLASSSIIKTRLQKTHAHLEYDDLQAKAMDVTILVMRDILQKGRRPERLSAYVSYPILGVLYNPRTVAEDQCISYEDWITGIDRDE